MTSVSDYDDGGALPYKKKAKKIDKSKCNHIFKETKRYGYTYLIDGKLYRQQNIVLRCLLCRKRQHEYSIDPE